MNEHEIGTFFTAAVRRLKNSLPYAEVKHLSCGVVKRPAKEETIALCDYVFHEEYMTIRSKITIYPRVVMKNTVGWSEESIRLTLLNTVCHEVAHHLVTHRTLTEMRNRLCHDNKRIVEEMRQFIDGDNENSCHGAEWQSIMEELGASADQFFVPSTTVPKAFRTV